MKQFRITAILLITTSLLLSSCAAPTATAAPVSSAIPTIAATAEPTTATSKALTLDYPRLGMWWPDLSTQPLEDVARYDWVILGDWDSGSVADLKALNPNILLLNSTNACELSFDPDADLSDIWSNAEIQKIPAEWFLTQVGSTLTEEVDTSSTTLHVAAVTASDGTKTYDLFIPGDAVLIDGESALVTAVDAAALTLTVQRGYIRPALAHPVGTRIAAHISFWPNSWLLNLSTLAPLAIADQAIGAENWISYHARSDAALLKTAAWDGLLIDRSDANESWLISNSTARTIDPDQSNTLLSDYSAFDAAWNEGLQQYETKLRELVGSEKIIFVNWGMPNYSLLNGNNFEGFPGDISDPETISSWYNLVFGPETEKGSYFDWMANALQPNLTMIETYEDNGGPEPTSDGSYDNACADPGFTPDYRKMRFGLTTALLNDGFFSYEMNTNGHGSLCLMWFDEYDNAGAGRGYLGQPLGPAYPVFADPAGDVIFQSSLQDAAALESWELWPDDSIGNTAELSLDDGGARSDISAANGENWQVSLISPAIEMEEGVQYTLTFSARADVERLLSSWIQMDHDPWTTWMNFSNVTLTPAWQQFSLSGISGGSDASAQLIFGMGQQTGSVWIKDVTLTRNGVLVYRRDFTGGVVIINASAQPQTIDLGGTYVKIDGTQDRFVNDGSTVTSVTVGAYDGVILLNK